MHAEVLVKKRANCKSIVRKINKLEFEIKHDCNICGHPTTKIIANMDRYGISIRTAICPKCGLVYLVDRLTPDSYQIFYEDGIYRELISAYKGVEQTPQEILKGQENYAISLANSLGELLQHSNKKMELLDIGGSTGLISKEVEKSIGYQSTILELATKEVEVARQQGLKAEVGSIETWTTDKRFDLILLCRTFEHIQDLSLAFKRIRGFLKPDGVLFCDISDFSDSCKRVGPPQSITKIDHCFWISDIYAAQFFARVGFRIIHRLDNLPKHQIGYLLKPLDGVPEISDVTSLINQEINKYRQYDRKWDNRLREYNAIPNRIIRFLVKIKKKFFN
jgi:2-polyprenyl-3-methyl-5-hydroxy-6-metoxy-1,4-benzoquinol methylase